MKFIFVILIVICFCGLSAQDTQPDPPKFLSASVVPDSNPVIVRLNWEPSDSLDVEGYLVYKVEELTELLDTVEGRDNTTYQFINSNATQNSEAFRLASYDSSANRSKLTEAHETIFLSIELNKCNNTVQLEWSEYVGWEDDIVEYRIFRRPQEESDYQIVTSLNPDIRTYEDHNLTMDKTYFYYVRAINSKGIAANSNSVHVNVEAYLPPAFLYGQSLNVIEEEIHLRFVVDNNAEVIEYRIQKSTEPDDLFQTIETVENIEQREIAYIDTDIESVTEKYYYKVVSVNPCGVVSAESNIISNIILEKMEGEDLFHSFTWTEFETWQNGVKHYEIYSNFDLLEEKITLVGPGIFQYTNTVEDYVEERHENQEYITNKYCYYIVAVEDFAGNPTGIEGVSRSNEACFFIEPKVWVPNAINVSSILEENRNFKPIVSFIEEQPYELVIMDRWGSPIYRTNSPHDGWEGVLKHSAAPPQKYMYLLRFYDHEGVEHNKTGSFILLNE